MAGSTLPLPWVGLAYSRPRFFCACWAVRRGGRRLERPWSVTHEGQLVYSKITSKEKHLVGSKKCDSSDVLSNILTSRTRLPFGIHLSRLRSYLFNCPKCYRDFCSLSRHSASPRHRWQLCHYLCKKLRAIALRSTRYYFPLIRSLQPLHRVMCICFSRRRSPWARARSLAVFVCGT